MYGVGARVRVTSGDMEQTRFIEAGGNGLYGSSAPEAYFAFPPGTEGVSVEVRWPGRDGAVTTWDNVPVRYIVTAQAL